MAIASGSISLPPVPISGSLPPTPTPISVAVLSITFPIQVTILPAQPLQQIFSISVNILPALLTYPSDIQTEILNISVNKIPIPLSDAMFGALDSLVGTKIDTFFDDDRVLKTLLNFGNDYQALITNWQYDSADTSGNTMLVKLYKPLPIEVLEKTQLWITREITPPVIDEILIFASPIKQKPIYLRPPNRSLLSAKASGLGIANTTLASLFSTASLDPVIPDDSVIKQWYTDDVNSVQLNTDFTDYRNFIIYGSAVARLAAFKNKLLLIENYNAVLALNSSSLALTGSAYITGSLSYPAIQRLASERINLIRSFDGYEQFLYYKSGSAYSSSLTTTDYQDQIYFHNDATWPKIGGNVKLVSSASTDIESGSFINPTSPSSNGSWYSNQLFIAQAYDIANPNSLINNVPDYLRRDVNNSEFLIFLDLIGHQIDNLKTYADRMLDIYDRDSNPNIGLSPDIIWTVAESMGIELPNQYAIKRLVDYTIGQVGNVTPQTYRLAAGETWKRFLHNQIFMMKTKGTAASLRALANSYGILPTTIQIRETATPSYLNQTGSFELYEEQTNALQIANQSYLTIPWSASNVSINSVELRFSTTTATSSVLFNLDNVWALTIQQLSGSWARLAVVSGSTPVVSSSYFQIFNGNYYHAMVRYNTSGTLLSVERPDNYGNIIEKSITQASVLFSGSSWFTSQNLYLGASGTFFGPTFTGNFDEFRMWGETITDSIFDYHVKYPGLYNGSSSTSAVTSLYARLSFHRPANIG
jgi:hypothetical protein